MSVAGSLAMMVSVLALPQGGITGSAAQSLAAAPSPLFSDAAVVEFTLSTDFRLLKRERGTESNDRPAEIQLQGSDATIALQARTRGNFRLRRSTCDDMPPIRLNFATKSVQGTVFEGQDKVKLVTHCRRSGQYEQNTLQEFFIYRMYNLLTDRSFRVRLAKITYVDTSGQDDPTTRFAFLIEDEEALAARLGGIMPEQATVHPLDYDLHAMLMLSMFEHMIGNTDWSMVRLHNVKLFRTEEGVHYPIPYDFDWSGLVNAAYAEPDRSLGIRSVRDRLFRGFCLDGLDYEAAVREMQRIRPELFALLEGQEGLKGGDRKDVREYLERYYEILDSENQFRRKVIGACRPV